MRRSRVSLYVGVDGETPSLFTLEPDATGTKIRRIFVMRNPDKLRRVPHRPLEAELECWARLRNTDTMVKAAFTKRSRPAGLVITPGASADRDHPTLLAIEAGIPELPVLRLTLATTRVPTAVNKIVEAGTAFAKELGVAPKKIAYGGRSFGGRSCSVAVAQGLPAAALVLLSYPLHPPGKPENLRTDHFGDISVPTLFVSGEKDPFGTPAEFAEHLDSIPSTTTIEWVRGNHSPKGNDEIVDLVRSYLGY